LFYPGNRGYVLTGAASFFGSPVQLDAKNPRECGGKERCADQSQPAREPDESFA
jgi:hypothetical protein